MNKYDIIFELKSYFLTDSEWKTLVLSNIPSDKIFNNIVEKFRDITWYNNPEWFNDWYDYSLEELEEFIEKQWYFIYSPTSDTYISF